MTDALTDLLTTLTDQPSTPPGYHPDDTFTLWCREWDDRVVHGSGTVGPEYSYDGGLVTLPGSRFAARLREPLTQAKDTRRPISRIEIRRNRETIATLTEDQAWDLVAEAGPWTVYADYEDGVTKTEYRTKSEAHSAALAAAQSSGGGTPRPDFVAVLDYLGREEWSDYPQQFADHAPTTDDVALRIDRAQRALAAYIDTGYDPHDALSALLTDLRHWADACGADFHEASSWADELHTEEAATVAE